MQLPSHGPVLVIGPGALGTLLAVRLAAAGQQVVVAARTEEAATRLNQSGLVAWPTQGSKLTAKPLVVATPRQLDEVPRLTVLATKCAAAVPALNKWLNAFDDDAPVVALQNGVLGDMLAPLLGDRHVECTASIPATLESPGVSRQTGPGALHIGPWPQARGRDDPKVYKEVAAILSDAAPVHGSANMRGIKWTKLLVNSCITSLGVATGKTLGELLADGRARRAFLDIVEEGYAAGRADDVQFEAVSGFRPGLFAARLPGRGLLLRAMGCAYARQRSSSLQSLERGQKTEIDYLNGYIVATARRHALAAPVNEALVNLVHDIEDHRVVPALNNLDLLATR